MTFRNEPAKIFIRRNGEFGSSCDGTQDTGHFIAEDSGRFTVYPVGEYGGAPIVVGVAREEAEAAITRDWRANT